MRANYFPTRLMVENCQSLVTPLPGGAFIQKLLEAIGGAQHRVDALQYQWNFYPHKPESPMQELNNAVMGASRRGVKVRVYLNIESYSHNLSAINNRAKANLTNAGIAVKFSPQFPIMHSKIFLIDDDIVVLGSHNLSHRSVTVNDETSVLIKSREVCMEFRRYFELLWTRN